VVSRSRIWERKKEGVKWIETLEGLLETVTSPETAMKRLATASEFRVLGAATLKLRARQSSQNYSSFMFRVDS